MKKSKILIEAEAEAKELGVDKPDAEEVATWSLGGWIRMERDELLQDAISMQIVYRDKKIKAPKIAGMGMLRYAIELEIWFGEFQAGHGPLPMREWLEKAELRSSASSADLEKSRGNQRQRRQDNARALEWKASVEAGDWQAARIEAVRRHRVTLLMTALRSPQGARLPEGFASSGPPEEVRRLLRIWKRAVNRMALAYRREADLLAEDLNLRSEMSDVS